MARGHFKGARALLSPCQFGVPWTSVLARTTIDHQSGDVIEVLNPKTEQVMAAEANAAFSRVSDIDVEVQFEIDNSEDEEIHGHVEFENSMKSVSWADEDDEGFIVGKIDWGASVGESEGLNSHNATILEREGELEHEQADPSAHPSQV